MKRDDSMYILRQPKNLIATVLVYDNSLDLPIDQSHHTNLLRLTESSDVFLVIPKGYNNFNPERFAGLYDLCGVVLSDEPRETIINSFLFTLSYITEIFNRHLSFLLGDFKTFVNYPSSDLDLVLENTKKLNVANIQSAIGSIRVSSSQEYYEIYKSPATDLPEEGKNESVLGVIRKGIQYLLPKGKVIDTSRNLMYLRYLSSDAFIYLRMSHVREILSFKDTESGRSYISTFKFPENRTITDFLASYIKYSRINVINSKLEELDFKSLKS